MAKKCVFQFDTFDEAYCFLLENGYTCEYDPTRTNYPNFCVGPMAGASYGKWLVSTDRAIEV